LGYKHAFQPDTYSLFFWGGGGPNSLPPSAPEVVDGNERSMNIKWKAPIDDGGMPITAYHIEAKVVGGEWQPWELLDNPSTRAQIQKLQKGMEYQFRVIAINKAGKSEPSHPSRPRLAKETDRKYLRNSELSFRVFSCKHSLY